MENQRVLVICNVFPREIHGHRSEAGLLVARSGKGKAAARPPEAAPLGEAVDGERRPGEDFYLDLFRVWNCFQKSWKMQLQPCVLGFANCTFYWN